MDDGVGQSGKNHFCFHIFVKDVVSLQRKIDVTHVHY